MSKILITGVSGLLGNNLALAYRYRHKILGIYNAHEVSIKDVDSMGLDLLDKDSLLKIPNEFKPDIIIHCAALSEVDKCEENKDLAYKLNVGAAQHVIRYAKEKKAYLVYVSTECVYNGICGNFKEDSVDPVNYYGETKLLGEKSALKYDNTLIVRTNFFGRNIQKKLSLAEWMLNSLKQGKLISGFSDSVFSAMYTFLFAEILEQAFSKKLKGIYNLASADSISKYNFALSLADMFKLDKGLIKEISVEEFDFKAKRGKDMSLNIDKISKDLNIKLPSMQDSIVAFHRDYINGGRNDMRECFNHV